MSGATVLMSVVRVSGPITPPVRSASVSAIDPRPPTGSTVPPGSLSAPAIMLVSLNASACAHTVNCVWLPVSTRNEIDAAGLRNSVTSSSAPSPSTSSVATPTLSTLPGVCATKPPPLALNAIVSFRTSGANCARSTLTAMPGPCSSSVHAVAATAAAAASPQTMK